MDLGRDARVVTVCPRSSDPFYIVSYYMKGVTTSWTYSKDIFRTPETMKMYESKS